jgi:hypothetical protein
MRSVLWLVGVIAWTGCERKATEKRFEGPMPIVFGDCAGAGSTWVSGPRPMPFTPADADNPWVATESSAVAVAPAPKPDVPAAPVAAEPPPSPAEAEAARKQVIEAGRAAGVLGSTALVEGGAFASLTGTGDISAGIDDTAAFGGLFGHEEGELQGGFGYGRTGFASSSSGFGTIGTGRYGTIGHGSGTGIGYGIGGGYAYRHRGAPSGPTVSIGQPDAALGDLDKAIIRRYVKRNIQKIQYCFEKQLLVHPALGGTVTAEFFITPSGEVATSKASGVDREVSSCIADVIKSIVFPKPKGSGGVMVHYPFVLASNAAPGVVASATGSGAGSGSDTGSARDSGSGSAGSATPAAGAQAADRKRRLFRAGDLQAVPATPYEPGAANPLRAERAALETCLRAGGAARAGPAVFELVYDASGKATRASVHGIDDKGLEACVTAVAKKVKRVGSGSGAQRCSIAYGEMPLAAMPALDIGAEAITFGNIRLGVAEATADTASGKLDALASAIEDRVAKATAKDAPVVALHGPIVVKPVDTTKMKLVTRAIASVLAAGDDFVLASQRGAEWSLLSPMALPVVPVPLGTGGIWNNVKVGRGPGGGHVVDDEDRVTLSVLVRGDAVDVEVSRVNERETIPRDAQLLAKLAETLKTHKASAFFMDRDDVEIAIDSDLTYADYVSVVRTAIAAGFTRWRFTEPRSLSR